LGVAGADIAAVAGDLCDVEAMVALKDLLGLLGSNRHECRVDGAGVPTSDRSHYLFNTGLAAIERADVILLVGTNPRWEAPLVNTRLRKAVRRGGATVFNIGPDVDLTYPVTQLGDDAGVLGALPQAVADALARAERPAVVVGMGGIGGIGAVHALAATHGFVRDGWNGVNLLHTAASRVGALDIGFTTDGGMAAIAATPPKLLFNLGVDEVEVSGGFTVYIGHHGDRGVRTADVILPAAAYTEKSGTWVNLEGRVQRGIRATFPPGEAREDWTIFRALSAVLGDALPYDDLRSLRGRIAAEWPHLAAEGLTPAVWSAPSATGTAAPAGPFTLPVTNFYLTSAIARASATMAECVDQIVDADEPRLEAAE